MAAVWHDCPVLVVDDDQAIREMVTAILEDEGYPVRSADDGMEAIEAIDTLRGEDPDCPRVILLDMRMPELDGWGVARSCRERGLSIAIVVMTAARDARPGRPRVGAGDRCRCLPRQALPARRPPRRRHAVRRQTGLTSPTPLPDRPAAKSGRSGRDRPPRAGSRPGRSPRPGGSSRAAPAPGAAARPV